MADSRRGSRLDQPREPGRLTLPRMDTDAFGRFAEGFARFMGTPRFIFYMTIFVIVWVTINIVGIFGLQWDPYPFILLNLIFSTQASYAAPLILLAQNRQADRDRLALEEDRRRATMQKADTEYLAREIAALRIALSEVATRDFIRSELEHLLEAEAAARKRDVRKIERSSAKAAAKAAQREAESAHAVEEEQEVARLKGPGARRPASMIPPEPPERPGRPLG